MHPASFSLVKTRVLGTPLRLACKSIFERPQKLRVSTKPTEMQKATTIARSGRLQRSLREVGPWRVLRGLRAANTVSPASSFLMNLAAGGPLILPQYRDPHRPPQIKFRAQPKPDPELLSRENDFRTDCPASHSWCGGSRGPCGCRARPGTPRSTSSPRGCHGTCAGAWPCPGRTGPWRAGS